MDSRVRGNDGVGGRMTRFTPVAGLGWVGLGWVGLGWVGLGKSGGWWRARRCDSGRCIPLTVILANAGIHFGYEHSTSSLPVIPVIPVIPAIPAQAGIQAVYHYYEQSDKTKDHRHHEHTV